MIGVPRSSSCFLLTLGARLAAVGFELRETVDSKRPTPPVPRLTLATLNENVARYLAARPVVFYQHFVIREQALIETSCERGGVEAWADKDKLLTALLLFPLSCLRVGVDIDIVPIHVPRLVLHESVQVACVLPGTYNLGSGREPEDSLAADQTKLLRDRLTIDARTKMSCPSRFGWNGLSRLNDMCFTAHAATLGTQPGACSFAHPGMSSAVSKSKRFVHKTLLSGSLEMPS